MSAPVIRLGLRENAGQFSLLVLVNAFVGAMIGLERSILPAIAEQEFQIAARNAAVGVKNLPGFKALGLRVEMYSVLWGT